MEERSFAWWILSPTVILRIPAPPDTTTVFLGPKSFKALVSSFKMHVIISHPTQISVNSSEQSTKYSVYNKLPQTWWLEMREFYSATILEA